MKRSTNAWESFKARVAELGGEVLEPRYMGKDSPHKVRCREGHINSPTPGNIRRGTGICWECGRKRGWGKRAPAVFNRFKAEVERHGGQVLEASWLGGQTPHRVRCAEGHTANPRPNNVLTGRGICAKCAGRAWDAFYVVRHRDGVVKFGITSGNPKSRLDDHKRDGFVTRVVVRTGLPDGVARSVETELMRRLRAHGIDPIRGREYFPANAASLIEGWAKELLP